MVKHIASILSQGRLEIDHNNCVVNIISKVTNSIIHSYPYSEINYDDWGYVYEKYVGQKYEEEGYQVEYLGLKKGFLDGGMDVVISKDDFKSYIQCKYSSKSKACFGKQKIEWILYNASSFLSKQYKDQKLNFWLVVPTQYTTTNKKRFTRVFPIKKQLAYRSKCRLKKTSCSSMGHFAG